MSRIATIEGPAETRASAEVVGVSPAAPYSNPYLAGIGLGLVLLSAFVIMGRGLGASGAFKAVAAFLANAVSPAYAHSRAYLGDYLGDGSVSPLKNWLLFEVLGVMAGAFLSGMLARRVRYGVEKGTRASVAIRFAFAFGGGVLTATGAALGRGCTSGQALTGGSLLNVGSWAFMLSVFAGAYALAYFVRGEWT
jgi:hypothetical protein